MHTIGSEAVWFFLSDMHLSDTTPHTLDVFEHCITHISHPLHHIVLLGDIFETWIGDDDPSPCHIRVQTVLKKAKTLGAQLYFIHGNRDFLAGPDFLKKIGILALPDPYYFNLFGIHTLLSHGDLFCTDDVDYQQFRAHSRSESWKTQFLEKPLSERNAIAQNMRQQSEQAKKTKKTLIMDVNQEVILDVFNGDWSTAGCANPVGRIIHGHTHRPGHFKYLFQTPDITHVQYQTLSRFVLTDWDCDHEPYRGGYLKIDQKSARFISVVDEPV